MQKTLALKFRNTVNLINCWICRLETMEKGVVSNWLFGMGFVLFVIVTLHERFQLTTPTVKVLSLVWLLLHAMSLTFELGNPNLMQDKWLRLITKGLFFGLAASYLFFAL